MGDAYSKGHSAFYQPARQTAPSDFYHLLLTNLIADVEAGIRMLDDRIEPNESEMIATRSTLRRAISEAKEGIRSYENE